jgi:aminoglycoside 2'-N-acetyltransferase I
VTLMQPADVPVRSASTADLTASDLAALRSLFSAAWPDGDFGDDDFANAMGGRHWLAVSSGSIVAHAAVVVRVLEAGGRPLRTGYDGGRRALPAFERRGIGSLLVAAASDHVRASFELGALSTVRPAFYERLGWERWRGPTYVRRPEGLLRTEDEDDGILVLRTPRTPPLSLTEALSCDWRPGDPW